MNNLVERKGEDIKFENIYNIPPNLKENGGNNEDNYTSILWIAMIFIVLGIAFLLMKKK